MNRFTTANALLAAAKAEGLYRYPDPDTYPDVILTPNRQEGFGMLRVYVSVNDDGSIVPGSASPVASDYFV